MSIARQLVEKMGGTIGVDSIPGQGSRFWCELEVPLQEAPEEEPAEPQPHLFGYRGVRRNLLVVDDNEINCLVLQELLESRGFLVELAFGGEEGLEKARVVNPELVLLDIRMPDMDGYTILGALRQDPELDGVPVVAVSAGVSKGQRAKAKRAGFDGFVGKPIGIDELFGVLGDLLGLEWLDGDEAVAPEPAAEALEPPPADELAELAELVSLGKLPRIVEWAEVLEGRAPRYALFARRARALALELDEENLRVLIKAGQLFYSAQAEEKHW